MLAGPDAVDNLYHFELISFLGHSQVFLVRRHMGVLILILACWLGLLLEFSLFLDNLDHFELQGLSFSWTQFSY